MKKLLLLTFLFTSFLCEAQQYIPQVQWKKKLQSINGIPFNITKLSNGNFAVAYSQYYSDLHLAEINSNGSLLYDSYIFGLDYSVGSREYLRGMFQLNDSIIIIPIPNFYYPTLKEDGSVIKVYNIYRHVIVGSTNLDYTWLRFAKKLDDSSFLWSQGEGGNIDKRYLNRSNQVISYGNGYGIGNAVLSFDILSNKDIVTIGSYTGILYVTISNPNLGIVKKEFTFGGTGIENAISVKVDNEDNIILYSTTSSNDGDITNFIGGVNDFWVLKIDTNGNKLWDRCLGGVGGEGDPYSQDGNMDANTLSFDNDENIIITGTTSSFGIGQYSAYIAKIDKRNGKIIWQSGLNDIRKVRSMQVLLNDTILLLGYKGSNGTGWYGDSLIVEKIYMKKIDFPDSISGFAFIPNNTNCQKDVGELSIKNMFFKTEPTLFYGVSDTSGKYTILTDTGTYRVKQITPTILKPFLDGGIVCPAIGYHTVSFTQYGQDTSEINFAYYEKQCAYLQVELAQGRMRRCFDNTTTIKYCNIGNVDTTNVQVIVTLPEYVTFVSASNTNYTISGKKITFNIGNLRANECGTINLITKVDCVNGITGLTQCISAYILPRNKCVDQIQPDYALWDKSEVSVDGRCTGNTARFVIKNIGQNNMTDSSSYRIYKDAVQAVNKKFKLIAGDSLVINVTALGFTYRLEADQVPHFPSASLPSVTIENCGTGVASRGFVSQMPQNTVAPDVEKICLPIRDSYDPNDKSVSPSGVGINKLVKHKVPLDYLIRFQNTGTDTAYTVVIIDTLDQNLDLSTLEFGASSHTYKIEFTGSGKPILKFTFDKINLVDSFTNEPKSHGFVSFKITPYDSIPNGTLVKNSADIYFDFNLPIKTNTTQVSIDDRLPTGATLSFVTAVKEQKNNYEAIYVYPNPFTNTTNFEFVYNTKATQLILYNVNGELVSNENIANQTTYQFHRNNIANGMYFYVVQNKEGEIIGRGKLVLQ